VPFGTAKQEHWMKINQHTIWKRWVKKYGHHPGFKASLKRTTKKKTQRKGKK
jgi:hypothetical protein